MNQPAGSTRRLHQSVLGTLARVEPDADQLLIPFGYSYAVAGAAPVHPFDELSAHVLESFYGIRADYLRSIR